MLQNGAPAPTGQQAPAANPQAPATPAPAEAPKPAAPDYQALHQQAERRAADLDAKLKAAETERLNRLKADKARERDDEEKRKNPVKYLQSVLGDDWYDAATKLKTGTVAPGQVSAALDEREQRLRQHMDETTKELRSELAELRAEREERARADLRAKAADHARANPEKYPLLARYKQHDEVGHLIEQHFNATARRDADGNWAPGELWSYEVAAQKAEERWAAIRDMVLKSENGRELPADRETPRLTIVPEPNLGPPKDDAEKRRRIDEAFAKAQKQILGRPN